MTFKFGNFLFPECLDPAADAAVIDDALREAELTDRLGFDAIWLSEHHFDGNSAYCDPMTFAAALATRTRTLQIGFAVIQTALYHPVRLAEQLSLLDHLSKGRLLIGLGRGTFFNIYEYEGYGLDPDEAQARFEEAEQIILGAWRSAEEFQHQGKFWTLRMPMLRPRPFTRPHPEIYRSASTEHSIRAYGQQKRLILLNAQTNAVTRQRVEVYRQSLREAGVDEPTIAEMVGKIWVWRTAHVAETDALAETHGGPAFVKMIENRGALRKQIQRERGVMLSPDRAPGLEGFICGSPATVAETLAELADIGIAGALMQFRLGAMPLEQTAASLELFATKVAPQFRR
ncbi:MAG: LLM class flavin-dependent oxidoreductase [Alphaproteobacteria bacterium]|nr:LLM class flavin-dependent oxidoreductase [Alphaproteobacteria bacterium]